MKGEGKQEEEGWLSIHPAFHHDSGGLFVLGFHNAFLSSIHPSNLSSFQVGRRAQGRQAGRQAREEEEKQKIR